MIRAFKTFNRNHPRVVNVGLFFAALCITFIAVEIGFRIVLKWRNPEIAALIGRYSRLASSDDSPMRFEAHPYVAYAPSYIQYKKGGMQIRDRFFAFKKPPNTVRIACLGGSTTMAKYPVDLQRELNRWPGGTSFEVMDFGCDGWTLTESTINFLVRAAAFKPDIAIVHHGANDGAPRQWPNFQPDYAHFRKPWDESALGSFLGNYLSGSWLVSYLGWRSGLSAFDLQNLTIHRVPQESIHDAPAPHSIDVIQRNFNHLSTMAQTIGSKLLIAPMPHLRKKEKPNIAAMIDEFNDCARSIARDKGWPVAETDPLMQKHPQWFRDWVHVNKNGDFLKAQVYAMAVWDMLGRYPQEDAGSAIETFGRLTSAAPNGRDIELHWDFDKDARRFDVSVRKEGEKAFQLLGRTPSGSERSYRWKRGNLAPGYTLEAEFQDGPTFGHAYYFKVVAIGKDDPPKVVGHMTSNKEVKALERPIKDAP